MSVAGATRSDPHRLRAVALLIVGLSIVVGGAFAFLGMHEPEPIIPGPGVTRHGMLGEFVPAMSGTPADTPVFILEGSEPGGTLLLLGGSHPQEISGVLAAVLAIENARVVQGRIIVIPQANRSGFTYTEPLEGFPERFEIDTPAGPRWFRLGMRLTNPIHQWPDPELFVHYPSGERMVGLESRNLNRTHPGRADGTFTERLSHAIMTLALEQHADIVFDMHEAYPEYPIINMFVAHERAYEIATFAALYMQLRGIPMDLMPSPRNLHGLSHREFGDHTGAYALLTETANPAMGRFRGRTDEDLVTGGQDQNYVRAATMGLTFVPFTAAGHPLYERVARQLAAVEEVLNSYNETHPDAAIIVQDLPTFEEVMERRLGAFLLPPP